MFSFFAPDKICKLIAIIPIYEEGRDATRVITTDDDITILRQCRTVIKHLAKANFTDLEAVNEVARKKLGRKRNLPLFIGQELFLIPFSLREPRRKNDATLGYVNDDYLEIICLAGDKHIARLLGGHELLLRKRAERQSVRLLEYKKLKRHFKKR